MDADSKCVFECLATCIAFQMKLFNISVAGVDIQQFGRTPSPSPSWKQGNRVNKATPTAQFHCSAHERRSWLRPTAVKALGTRLSQHGFKPRHSSTSVLLPISARVVTGFNQRKLPSRTIIVEVDISKAFDTDSHRLIIEMIHRS